jgi:alpha-tubulin suppressor-like RCC1 family protein
MGRDQLFFPTPVAGGLTFASVSSSWFHTCGLTTGGVGYCWGSNEFGQLGNGQTLLSKAPARILGQP